MYAKIKNQEILKFPYDIMDLFKECPETIGFGCDILNLFNNSEKSKEENSELVFVNLNNVPDYDVKKQTLIPNQYSIEYNNGQWIANYVLKDYSAEEIAQFESISHVNS